VSETASISTGIAARYATAVFELTLETKSIAGLESDMAALAAGFAVSGDLSLLIASPVYSRAEQRAAVLAIAKKMDLGPIVSNTLGLMADNRRLFVLPQLIDAINALIAEEKGEVSAEVTSASKLTSAQQKKLTTALKKAVGKDVKINATVDASLIGGLIVKVGSKMIDSSISSRLSNLQNAMKEVG